MVNHFLKLSDIAPEEIQPILDRAIKLKSGASSAALAGKSVAILFEKPSLRTKLSFWVGAEKLGGNPVHFAPEEVGLGKREPVADVANVMSRMSDMAVIRTFAQSTLEEFAAAVCIEKHARFWWVAFGFFACVEGDLSCVQTIGCSSDV